MNYLKRIIRNVFPFFTFSNFSQPKLNVIFANLTNRKRVPIGCVVVTTLTDFERNDSFSGLCAVRHMYLYALLKRLAVVYTIGGNILDNCQAKKCSTPA